MSVADSDGIGEALEETLRVGLTAAGRVAEARIREQQRRLQEAQAQSEQATRELRARLAAERAVARAELAPVAHAQWWEQATPGQIEDAWETAQTWRASDPQADRAAIAIRTAVTERYGIDLEDIPPGGSDNSAQAAQDASEPAAAESAAPALDADVEQGRSLGLLSQAKLVFEAVRSRPRTAPRARRSRVRAGQPVERERGR